MGVFIIAEAGVNHNGDLALAKKLVDVAVSAGADAVKFQAFVAERLVTRFAEKAKYQVDNMGTNESQSDMLKKLEFSPEAHRITADYCKEKGIMFMSSPFDVESAQMLYRLGMEIFKIPSGEITNLPLLRVIGSFKKQVILATGMADLEETKRAVEVLRTSGSGRITVLHSTSNYPPSDVSLNLNVIQTLRQEFVPTGLAVGYSDNGSVGVMAEVVAVALGATVIEKHFTLDKAMKGPDHKASMDPQELAQMVQAIRRTEQILGSFIKGCTPEEEPIKQIARKSIVAVRDIAAGELLSEDNLTTKRPGTGISPMRWDEIAGTPAKRDFKADELIEL